MGVHVMEDIINFFTDLWDTFIELVKAFILAILDALYDFLTWVLKQLLEVVLYIISLIPIPDGLLDGLALWDMLPEGLTYFLDLTGFFEGLAILGTCFVVRMTRKLLTLFQW